VGDSEGDSELVEVTVEGGVERRLSQQRVGWLVGLAWVPDGRGLIVNTMEAKGGVPISYLSYRGGDFRRITNDLKNTYFGVSLSADSRALVSVGNESASDAWVAPLAEADTAKPITSGGVTYWATWSPDRKIVCQKVGNIWVMESDGRNPRQLTVRTKVGAYWLPRVSPDGHYVVFTSSGDNYIWRTDIDGNNLKQLTNSLMDAAATDFSLDGKWVIYANWGTEKGIWKVPIEGGDSVRLSDADAHSPATSPDGRWIAYSYLDQNATPKKGIAIMAFEGGSPTKRFDIPQVGWVRWDADGRSLLYTKSEGGVDNIWRQPVAGGTPTHVTHFVSDSISSFDVSRDGKWLLIGRLRRTTDAVLIRDLR
jgi:Tol biopolymer transport system component